MGAPRWSDEHLDALRRLYPSAPRAEVTAACGGRKWSTIKKQAEGAGLRRETKRLWTEAEDAYLTAAWRDRTLPGISEHLGRTPDAVEARAQELGLSGERWADHVTLKGAADLMLVSPPVARAILKAYWEHYKALPYATRIKLPSPRLVSPLRRAALKGTYRVVYRAAVTNAWAWWAARETLTQAAERRGVWWWRVSCAVKASGEAWRRNERRDPAWWDSFIDATCARWLPTKAAAPAETRRAA